MPTATAQPSQAGLSSVAAAAQAAGFTGQGLITAIAVAGAESGFGANPGPSATGDYGDWQINHQAHPQYDTSALLSNPLYNAQAAYAVSGGGVNWSPWTTYTSGAYEQFLPAAEAAVSDLQSAAGNVLSFVFPLAAGTYTQGQGYHANGGTHPGVDLDATLGTPIYAVTAGTIKSVGGDPSGFGNDYPVESLPDGTTLTYGHAEKSLVQPGQAVAAGQLIALVGSEGDSTGPHLHFQVNLPGGATTDPLAWLTQHNAATDTAAQLTGLAGASSTGGAITAQTAAFNPLSSTDWKSLLADLFVIVMKGVVVLAGAAMVVIGVASMGGKSVKLPSVVPIPV